MLSKIKITTLLLFFLGFFCLLQLSTSFFSLQTTNDFNNRFDSSSNLRNRSDAIVDTTIDLTYRKLKPCELRNEVAEIWTCVDSDTGSSAGTLKA
ncbi:Tar ligand binding domain-containing protein [Morganella morganii]|uniref:Tar ligand binding domain-containing protein n=1 Tax=Morganella morganii TaxID=582 RepID=UPI003CC7C719